VQPDLVREAAARADLKDVVQELAELAGLRAQGGDAWFAGQDGLEMVAHHAGAAPGGTDHMLERCEHLQHLAGQRPRIVEETRVRHRLAAASLRLGEVDLDAIPFQDLRRRQPDAGIELVDVARNEERDVHRARF